MALQFAVIIKDDEKYGKSPASYGQ